MNPASTPSIAAQALPGVSAEIGAAAAAVNLAAATYWGAELLHEISELVRGTVGGAAIQVAADAGQSLAAFVAAVVLVVLCAPRSRRANTRWLLALLGCIVLGAAAGAAYIFGDTHLRSVISLLKMRGEERSLLGMAYFVWHVFLPSLGAPVLNAALLLAALVAQLRSRAPDPAAALPGAASVPTA